MDCIQFVSNLQNFNEPPYLGSFQQLLSQNIGKKVKIDFQMGINGMVSHCGIIASTGLSYVILEQENNRSFIVGDVYSIKFITFLC